MFVQDTGYAYKILEIESTATDEEVKKAYRRMAMKYHPDKLGNMGEEFQHAAQEKFKKVNEAYQIIKKERNLP
jgi:DnaJ like chaperone protein